MYIGVDPGKKGGLCVMSKDGGIVELLRLGDDFVVAELLRRYSQTMDRVNSKCFVEQVGAMPGQGVTSMFTFGQGFGFLLGVLCALKIPYSTVTPHRWQKKMHTGIPGKGTLDAKKRSLLVVRQNYPDAEIVPQGCRVPHDGLVDAILIADYGRRTELEASYMARVCHGDPKVEGEEDA